MRLKLPTFVVARSWPRRHAAALAIGLLTLAYPPARPRLVQSP